MNIDIINRDLWFYDFEVFPYYWLVEFKNRKTGERVEIDSVSNSPQDLINFYNLHKNDFFSGYYTKSYDVLIWQSIMGGMNPYEISKKIQNNQKVYNIIPKNIKSLYPILNYDGYDGQHSLKQIEGFMGDDIKETQVDFDLNRPLTKEEIELTKKYCRHDVDEYAKYFELKEQDTGDFKAQLLVLEYFNLDLSNIEKTGTQLTAIVLNAIQQHTMSDEFNLRFPHTAILNKEEYKNIFNWYLKPENWCYRKIFATDKKQSGNWKRENNAIIGGIPHVLGYGGIHGCKDNFHYKGILVCLDVASLYPSLMIIYELLSRKIIDSKKYAEIKETRIEFKKVKNIIQSALKLILNKTYGGLKDRNNLMYDPLMSNLVCIFGQMLLVDLIEKVEKYGKLCQSNTDGIYIAVDNFEMVEKIKNIAHEWEVRTGLELECEIYNEIYQKDVNNYIMIKEENGKKKYKCKGSYLKKKKPFDNDLPILTTALIEYFVNNTPIEETINDCNDLMQFQKIIKLTEKYHKVVLGKPKTIKISKNGKEKYIQIIENEEQINGKVQRVFASKNPLHNGIYKIKKEDKYEVAEKISYTANNIFIDNSDIHNKKCPDYLDKNYYIELAKERLKQILIPEEEKIDNTPIFLYNCMQDNNNYVDFLKAVNEQIKPSNKSFQKYIIADCCNTYGKTKKLLDFIPYFSYLYGKKNININTLQKKFSSEIMAIILKNSQINITGKTLVINDNCLQKIFDSIPNEELNINDILLTQADLFEELRYINPKLEDDLFVVQNYSVNIKPTVIIYQLSTGRIEYCFVNEKIFKILPLRDGDIIKVNKFKYHNALKIQGKDNNGINILIEDEKQQNLYIEKYSIVERLFKSKLEDEKY